MIGLMSVFHRAVLIHILIFCSNSIFWCNYLSAIEFDYKHNTKEIARSSGRRLINQVSTDGPQRNNNSYFVNNNEEYYKDIIFSGRHDYWLNKKLNSLDQDWFHIKDSFWIYGGFWDHRIRDGEFSPSIIGQPPYIRILLVGPYNDKFPEQLKKSTCEYYYEKWSSNSDLSSVTGYYQNY